MPPHHPALPCELTVLERGWLSSNNILFIGPDSTALVDSGYCTHAEQTVALVQSALHERPLDLLLNTHLHSDHCGGNAALQHTWPTLHTAIPPGQAAHVHYWNAEALSYTPTGQQCPPFRADGLLQPGADILLGKHLWQIHAAPGHDPHSLVLFEPSERILISADALWHNGFGVVFPELDGQQAFEEVSATLDLITALAPHTVIPGHGQVFTDVADALARARRRLDGFVQNPTKHAHYAAKVMLKFKLLEWQRTSLQALSTWAMQTPYLVALHARYFANEEGLALWIAELVSDLERSGAAQRDGLDLVNL